MSYRIRGPRKILPNIPQGSSKLRVASSQPLALSLHLVFFCIDSIICIAHKQADRYPDNPNHSQSTNKPLSNPFNILPSPSPPTLPSSNFQPTSSIHHPPFIPLLIHQHQTPTLVPKTNLILSQPPTYPLPQASPRLIKQTHLILAASIIHKIQPPSIFHRSQLPFSITPVTTISNRPGENVRLNKVVSSAAIE